MPRIPNSCFSCPRLPRRAGQQRFGGDVAGVVFQSDGVQCAEDALQAFSVQPRGASFARGHNREQGNFARRAAFGGRRQRQHNAQVGAGAALGRGAEQEALRRAVDRRAERGLITSRSMRSRPKAANLHS